MKSSLSLLSAMVAVVCLCGQSQPPGDPPPAPAPPPANPPPQPPSEKLDRVAEIIAERLPEFHGSATWRQRTAIQTHLTVRLGEATVLEGVLTYETNRRRVRIDLDSGGHLILDGESVHVVGSAMTVEEARRHLELWPRILAIPFQLRDRGVQATQFRSVPLKGIMYDSIRLNYKSRTHDGREITDWRVLFSHPKTKMIYALANIPLLPLVKDATANDQFAVTMEEYADVEGAKLATQWKLWKWTGDLNGEPIGSATLTNMKFVVPADDAFNPPAPSPTQQKPAPVPPPDAPKQSRMPGGA